MDFRLNSPEGKQILATIRQGDYAHPGEEEAIAISLAGLSPDPAQRVLDVGCGRGGTADWIRRQGWPDVTGIDRDRKAIAYGRQRYPKVSYHSCDVLALEQAGLGRFDLLCLFNAFYAFAQQQAALEQLRAIAAPSTALRLFDYAQPTQGPLPPALGDEIGRPLVLDRVEEQFTQAGWHQISVVDLTEPYITWYGTFLNKLSSCRTTITSTHGSDWYDFFAQWYGALHQALQTGQMRGVLVRAYTARS